MDIAEFFENDHHEIDVLLEKVDFTDVPAAAAGLAEFDRRLERHIVWEEDVLFPAAARAMPALAQGPIAVMRVEHRTIRDLKSAAREALARGDGPSAKARVEEMLAVLGPHNRKEEQILYPMCDRLLAGPAARVVLEAVGAVKA